MALPTLVLVHGAWHSCECFRKVVSELKTEGYKCITPQLAATPAISDPGPAAKSSEPDIQMVRSLVLAETSIGSDVVVIGHSFGGVISCSAIQGLSPSKKPGRVLGLINIAAFLVPTNTSIIDFIMSLPAPAIPLERWSAPDESNQWMMLTDEKPTGIIQRLYHDVPNEEAKHHVNMLRKQSLVSMTASEGIYAGWLDVPSWYLLTTADMAMTPERQTQMIQLAREAGAEITVRELESSHSPFLSRPDEVVTFVNDAVAAFRGR